MRALASMPPSFMPMDTSIHELIRWVALSLHFCQSRRNISTRNSFIRLSNYRKRGDIYHHHLRRHGECHCILRKQARRPLSVECHWRVDVWVRLSMSVSALWFCSASQMLGQREGATAGKCMTITSFTLAQYNRENVIVHVVPCQYACMQIYNNELCKYSDFDFIYSWWLLYNMRHSHNSRRVSRPPPQIAISKNRHFRFTFFMLFVPECKRRRRRRRRWWSAVIACSLTRGWRRSCHFLCVATITLLCVLHYDEYIVSGGNALCGWHRATPADEKNKNGNKVFQAHTTWRSVNRINSRKSIEKQWNFS